MQEPSRRSVEEDTSRGAVAEVAVMAAADQVRCALCRAR